MSEKAVIAGAGPAGLTCAIYLAQAGWQVDVFSGEEQSVSCLAEAPDVRNYPGFPTWISGFDLLEKFIEQAVNYGVNIHPDAISSIDTSFKTATVTDGSTVVYDEFIMASGVKPREFTCDGIENIPVHTCAVCDGGMYGKTDNIVVIGGGDTAVNSALYLSGIVGKVYVIVRKDYLRATNRNAVNKLVSKPNVDIWYKSNVVSVSKETCTQRFGEVQFSHDMHWIRMDTGDECGASAIFSCIGYDVNEIPVLGEGKVWRCGDCIEKHHQVAVAVGSGAKVALDILGRS